MTPQQNWQKLTKRFKKVADKLGKPIDKGIFETVIALNALGFNTRMSCEGHYKNRTYFFGPWVDIDIMVAPGIKKLDQASDELLKKIDQLKIDKADKEKIDALYSKFNHLKLLIHKKHLKITRKLVILLEEFYQDREVSFDTRLILDIFPFGTRLMSQGTVLQDGLKMDEKRQNLKQYQQEMKEFTVFLKSKYFYL